MGVARTFRSNSEKLRKYRVIRSKLREVSGEVGVQQPVVRIELAANFSKEIHSLAVGLRNVFRASCKRLVKYGCAAPGFSKVRKVENEIVPAPPLCREGL